ncbi:MAG: glutamine-hydrolyzing carbamoyl-phosphate synthase small subunit [Actinomycetota bacterium]|jgi:carbamoyl-phosphate synthase small subunit
MGIREAALVLADGSVFEGEAIGADAPGGVASGEVVFNTVLSGYQEVLTDPSYAGQIVTFTYPHIGNYGTATNDNESRQPFCRGVIVRDLARRPSNHRSVESLSEFLLRHGVSGIAGIDTRRLTRVIRDSGSISGAFGTESEAVLLAAARADRGTSGVDLVSTVTTDAPYRIERDQRLTVVAYDFGIKSTILSCLAEIANVEVVPASMSAADVLSRRPDGVFLSNGPGDPSAVPYAVDAITQLLGRVPIFGICLGHQLLCRALGGETFKLPFGHHGGNHPVRHEVSGRVEITSQNHNYCVEPESLGGRVRVTHSNLNDRTNEGIEVVDASAFSVQYHPEAGPGPHDSRYLFAEFERLMNDRAQTGRV